MAEISAIIIVTVVVPFSRCSSGAIERREAQFDRRDERLNRRDQQFEQALREMHDLTAAVRKSLP